MKSSQNGFHWYPYFTCYDWTNFLIFFKVFSKYTLNCNTKNWGLPRTIVFMVVFFWSFMFENSEKILILWLKCYMLFHYESICSYQLWTSLRLPPSLLIYWLWVEKLETAVYIWTVQMQSLFAFTDIKNAVDSIQVAYRII